MSYKDLDIQDGMVLKASKAIEYLKDCAKQQIDECIDGDHLSCELTAAIEDIVYMIYYIKSEGMEWVMVSEHPMSASGLHIEKMVMAEA